MEPVDDATDFYEDDEPTDKIRAIVSREPDGVTERPMGAIHMTERSTRNVKIVGASWKSGPVRVDTSRVRIS